MGHTLAALWRRRDARRSQRVGRTRVEEWGFLTPIRTLGPRGYPGATSERAGGGAGGRTGRRARGPTGKPGRRATEAGRRPCSSIRRSRTCRRRCERAALGPRGYPGATSERAGGGAGGRTGRRARGPTGKPGRRATEAGRRPCSSIRRSRTCRRRCERAAHAAQARGAGAGPAARHANELGAAGEAEAAARGAACLAREWPKPRLAAACLPLLSSACHARVRSAPARRRCARARANAP